MEIESLPSIDNLKKLLQSIAILDLIISPEWDDRYYSFNSKWGKDEQMASMRNGCGDEFFVHFTENGCIVKGLAHESQLSSWSYDGQHNWKEKLKQVPSVFKSSLNEPAFSLNDISFCYWCKYNDQVWHKVDFPLDGIDMDDDIDGSDYLLECFDGNPATYKAYVKDYFEQNMCIDLIIRIYKHEPLSEKLVKLINPDANLPELVDEVEEIGYFNKY